MTEQREVLLEGLRHGMMTRVAHLFEVLSSATSGSEADVRFRKGVMNCLEAYDRACKIAIECSSDVGD